MQSRNIYAVIPAAGKGTRVGGAQPKQYLKLLGKTILEHTLEVFLAEKNILGIILVVNHNDPELNNIELLNHPKITLVQGGKYRAESVLAGLNYLKYTANINPSKTWVLVHDAARPCLRTQDLHSIIKITENDGAILAKPVTDTIKKANDKLAIDNTEDRSKLWAAMTPQFFNLDLLEQALTNGIKKKLNITDEASAMEYAGYKPILVRGAGDNLKITHEEDLALAEFYLTRRAKC